MLYVRESFVIRVRLLIIKPSSFIRDHPVLALEQLQNFYMFWRPLSCIHAQILRAIKWWQQLENARKPAAKFFTLPHFMQSEWGAWIAHKKQGCQQNWFFNLKQDLARIFMKNINSSSLKLQSQKISSGLLKCRICKTGISKQMPAIALFCLNFEGKGS